MISTQDFLTALIAPYTDVFDTAHIEIRCLGDYPFSEWFRSSQMNRAAAYAVRQSETRDVYMGVLPRTRGKRGGEALRYAAYLWCDVDGGDGTPEDALALLKASCTAKGLPAPNLLVRSGGGCHAYWRIAFPVPVTNQEEQRSFSTVLRRIVRAIGGDPALKGPHACPKATDAPRILRVPGTINHKNGGQRPVVLLRQRPDENVYPLIWWKAHLPPEPARAPRPINRSYGYGRKKNELFPTTLAKLSTPQPDGYKHYAMLDVAVAARKQGLDDMSIRSLTEQVGIVSGVPMSDYQQQRHLEGIVEWTMHNVQPDYTNL